MCAILTQGYAASITPGNFQSWKAEYPMQCMQTAQETRKQRLLLLKKKHGTWAALNKLIGWESTNARLSQIGAGSIRSGRNTPYVMGDDMAREIEAALSLASLTSRTAGSTISSRDIAAASTLPARWSTFWARSSAWSAEL